MNDCACKCPNRVFEIVAIDKAGEVYKTYIKDIDTAILANFNNPARLEEIRLTLRNALATVENQLTAIKYPNLRKPYGGY